MGGAVIVSFPPESDLPPKYFWPLVHPDNPAKTGHMWLYSPPFKVVDISLFMQNWNQTQSKHIPTVIVSEQWEHAHAGVEDLMENEGIDFVYTKTGRPPTMANIDARLVQTMQKFPPFSITASGIQIKYVTTQVGAIEGTLEQMRNLRLCGRYPAELYQRFLDQRANGVVGRVEG